MEHRAVFKGIIAQQRAGRRGGNGSLRGHRADSRGSNPDGAVERRAAQILFFTFFMCFYGFMCFYEDLRWNYDAGIQARLRIARFSLSTSDCGLLREGGADPCPYCRINHAKRTRFALYTALLRIYGTSLEGFLLLVVIQSAEVAFRPKAAPVATGGWAPLRRDRDRWSSTQTLAPTMPLRFCSRSASKAGW
jgi:hypothetical protein